MVLRVEIETAMSFMGIFEKFIKLPRLVIAAVANAPVFDCIAIRVPLTGPFALNRAIRIKIRFTLLDILLRVVLSLLLWSRHI